MTTKLAQTDTPGYLFTTILFRESIQVKNNPNLQKMLEEDILYVTRQCRTLVLLLSKLNGKEFSQRSVLCILKDAQKYTANKADDQTQMKVILRSSNRTQRVFKSCCC